MFWMMWTCHGILFSFLFFCLETLQESNWMKTTSVAVVFFSESIIPKILDHNYVQSSLSIITRHLGNGIWKTPYNWIFYGHWRQSCTKTFNLLLYASFSRTSLVFKFNLMLIEQFLSQFIYLSIFRYCILKFIQYL